MTAGTILTQNRTRLEFKVVRVISQVRRSSNNHPNDMLKEKVLNRLLEYVQKIY